MKRKVIAAGHICIDITPAFKRNEEMKITDVFKPGKLVDMGNVSISTGGSVANTGLGMKLLGANVTLMGKLGNDEFGDMICTILNKYGASDGMIRSEESSTSYSVVLAVPGNDRIFLHNPGANNEFYSDDVPYEALQEAALFHFGYPTLMRSMYSNGAIELVTLLKKVHAAGCATSLDLAAVDPDSEAGKCDWAQILEAVLPNVDFFVPSVEELCFMLDRERYEEWQVRANGDDITKYLDEEKDIKPLAMKCIELGAKTVLLKCGVPGMFFASAREDKLAEISERVGLDASKWADKSLFEKSYVPDVILSGTGAGDTSIAAFLTSMLEGEVPEECLHLATATGACCVTSYDALSGLKPLEELKDRIKSGWEKV